MHLNVSSVKPLENYILKINFSNGENRLFDMHPYLSKGIFRDLQNKSYFKKVRVVFGGIEWPNEQDLSSDTLYRKEKS